MTLIDSNVLIDIFSDDPNWFAWSAARLEEAARRGSLLINEVVYAETSIRYSDVHRFDSALTRAGITLTSIPRIALFAAGKAFMRYRGAHGLRTGVLPDFFIGAHAEVERLPLLTRDARRYRTYFPNVALIAPDSAP
ncbi:MAG: PIN domain-containing protein [Nitrobacter sp.]